MEEDKINELAEQINVHNVASQNQIASAQARQMQYQFDDQERTLAESQLDCEETLNKLYHLLKQDKKIINDSGMPEWKPLADEKKRVLTDEGVDRIMQCCESYINKETLLSNFDDKTINRRMLEFSLGLSGLIFMKYEIFFRTPTLDECHEILKLRIAEKVKRKEINYSILGKTYDEKEIKKEVLEEVDNRIEYEIQKIRQEKIKLNLREFEMIFIQTKALVEATHNRAWKGEERGSLRRHFNISEVIGGNNQMFPQKKKGWFGL